jgi:toxin ParE1/3/4
MKYKVRITREVQQELQAIGDYIARESPDASRRWRRAIRGQILSLKNFPFRHALAPEADTLGIALHQMTFGAYRVLYQIEQNEVQIWGVRHSARRPLEPGDLD